jgi:hypothetical protein
MLTAMKHGVLVLLLAVGCGDGGGSRGPVAESEYGREAATIFCAKAYRCCNTGELSELMSSGSFTNEAGCVDHFADEFGTDIDSVEYHSDAAGDCLDYADGASCEDYFNGGATAADPSCGQIFTGTLPDDAPCASDIQCTSGYCEFDLETSSQTCTQRPGEGDDCEFQCADGFACIDGTCSEPLDDGETCEFGPECMSGYCDDSGECSPAPIVPPMCTEA